MTPTKLQCQNIQRALHVLGVGVGGTGVGGGWG